MPSTPQESRPSSMLLRHASGVSEDPVPLAAERASIIFPRATGKNNTFSTNGELNVNFIHNPQLRVRDAVVDSHPYKRPDLV